MKNSGLVAPGRNRVTGWPPRWLTERDGTRSRGGDAIEFIEAYCRVVKESVGGPVGSLIVLRPWQKELVLQLLATRPDGKLHHRQALVGMARKQGKSALMSSLALWALLLGDDGGEVYSIAGDREQARITFGTARRMIELDPELASQCRVYRDAIEVPSSGAVWRVLASEASLREGLSPTLTLVDEVHVLPEEMWNVFALAQGARKEPLMVGITTAGTLTDSLGQESLCYRLYKYGQQVAQGYVDDPTFFFAWWEPKQGAEADHHDPKVWAEANPGLGDIVALEDFESAVRRTPESEFRTKRTNVFVAGMQTWLPHGAWDACAVERTLKDGEECVLGFDGSWAGDSTALVACTVDGFVDVVGAWERPANSEGWRVDIEAVEAAIREACKRYSVREVVCDPYRWQRTMQALESEGIPIVEWPTGSPARMVPATARFGEAVLEHRLTHNGNGVLARHVANCVLKTDRLGPRIVKESKMSARKIDAAVACTIAYDRATQLPVVDDRGPMIW